VFDEVYGQSDTVMPAKRNTSDRPERNDYPSMLQREWQAKGSPRENAEEYDPSPLGGPMKSVNGWVLFVGNLNTEGLRDDEIEKLFEEFGTVQSVRIQQARSQRPDLLASGTIIGYAFVEFRLRTEAQDAINRLHGLPFRGHPLEVTWAFVKPPQG
jgi:RNA-binding protein 8A